MNARSALPRLEHWTYLCLAAIVALMWFATLAVRPLFNPDEGRYAEIPREMLRGGDWIVPHLNGLAYIEKPPLQYWATAFGLHIFGQSEFGARFYSSLCGLATLIVVWLAASRLGSQKTAWRAAAILCGMALFLTMGQLLTLDMSLTFYMTLALAGFLLAQSIKDSTARTWMLVAWVATGFGVLTKGLIAAAIPAAVLTLYSVCTRNLTVWRRLSLSVGLPVFLAITVPWYWLAARRDPDFLNFFFVHEHVARYLTPTADREEAWWFFGAVFLAGSAPWTLSALRVLSSGWRLPTVGGEFNPALFLRIWVVFVLGFFSLSDSKLIPYILPAMPALAILIAALPSPALRRDLRLTALLTVIAALCLGAASFDLPRFIAASDRSGYFLLLARPLRQVAAVLAISGAYVLAQRRHGSTRAAVFLGAGWCLAWLLLVRSAGVVSPIYSGIGLAAALSDADRTRPIYSVATYDQTLPFYLGRTVNIVAYRGELDYGLQHDSGEKMATIAQFVERWSQETEAFAVMEITMFDDLKMQGVPMREVSRNVHRVLVARQ